MSLLLDALKKAAEQKAKKDEVEAPAQGASDETLLDPAIAGGAGSEGEGALTGGSDETEFEHTDLRARLERGERIAGDDTGLDFTDLTDSGRDAGPAAAPGGEETGLEYPDSTATRIAQDSPPAAVASEETALDVAEREPQPSPGEHETAQPRGDDTGLDIPEPEQTGFEQQASQQPHGDDTGLDLAGGDELAESDPDRPQTLEDETVVSAEDQISRFDVDRLLDERRPPAGDDDQPARALEDQTDISLPVSSADQIESSRPEVPPGADVAGGPSSAGQQEEETVGAGVDEDLSLLLVDPDRTGPGEPTSLTDPKMAQDRAPARAEDDTTHSGLGLVERTQTRITGERTDTQAPTLTNPTATQVAADETRADTLAAPTRATVTRPVDVTSTRTYAPDNYDRTLMKLPNDDASKLFAGMKSDDDVVMTPDYAKKVFSSKTSAQQVQHYKLYAGIAVVLILAIVIFGGLQYQDEAELIDASLRPLKRDPMPGIIKPQQQEDNPLFAETDGQVDARTIEIVQTASQQPAPEMPAAETVEVAAVEAGDENLPTESVSAGTSSELAMVSEPVSSTPQPQTTRPEQPLTEPGAAASGGDRDTGIDQQAAPVPASNNLQIETSSQYREIDVWLSEAYAAYQAGNTALAMTRYNQVLEADPGNRSALLGRAAINVQDGNIEAAIRDYRTLLLANPKDSLAMSSLLGVASYSPQETESQLKLMIRDEPDSPYLNFALANAYGAQNRWREAQGHYFKALQNNPQDPNYAYNLAVSLEHISQPASAITYYQRALDNFDKGLATFNREIVGQRLAVLGKL